MRGLERRKGEEIEYLEVLFSDLSSSLKWGKKGLNKHEIFCEKH